MSMDNNAAMTAKEYLSQAFYLDRRINSRIREAEEVKAMAYNISGPTLRKDKVKTSHSGEAPFEKALLRFWELEESINQEIDHLVDMKREIGEAIDQLPNENEQLVLRYRYVNRMRWEEIAEEMMSSRSTVIRWHESGLQHFVVPVNKIAG